MEPNPYGGQQPGGHPPAPYPQPQPGQQHPPQPYPPAQQPYPPAQQPYPPAQRPPRGGPPGGWRQPPAPAYGRAPGKKNVPWPLIGGIVGVFLLGILIKVSGVFEGNGMRVPSDDNLRLLLVLSVWNDTVNGQRYVTSLHSSGELNIMTYDEESEERITANGAWMVKDGHVKFDVHYSDDPDFIREGTYLEKVTAFGDDDDGKFVFGFKRVSGTAGIVGMPQEGFHDAAE